MSEKKRIDRDQHGQVKDDIEKKRGGGGMSGVPDDLGVDDPEGVDRDQKEGDEDGSKGNGPFGRSGRNLSSFSRSLG